MTYQTIQVDDPDERIRRITLARPEKRNAISNLMRAELFDALQAADIDDGVGVTILRGAGTCFSSGYDISTPLAEDQPYYTATGDGAWARHITQGWTSIWDLAKPVIAQVHGYAMAGGAELVAACDLAYVATDAMIGHPVPRVLSPPDFQFHTWLVGYRHAMELMLTGGSVNGEQAVEMGFANRAFPPDELDASVMEIARQVASVPSDLQQINKRSVHRQMEIMGVRTMARYGSELQGLAGHQKSVRARLEASDAKSTLRSAFD